MRNEWVVYLIGILIVVGGLAFGAHKFRQKSRAKSVENQMALIESLQAEKRYAEALDQSAALAPRVKNAETQSRLERLTIQILMRAGKSDDAQKRADAFLAARPDDPNLGTIHYVLGKIALEKDGNRKKAGQHFETVVTKYVSDPSSPAAMLGLANLYVLSGELLPAKERLDQIIEMPLEGELRAGVENLLGQVNTEILYSQILLPGEELYTIKQGDNLISIGKRYHVEPDLIMTVNRIRNEKLLRPGSRIKIPKLDFSILVNIGDNTLMLSNNGKFFKKYKVRTGRTAGLTPTGQFNIVDKLKNPQWLDPQTNKLYKSGDPENELGTRWLKFDRPGLGIHGTIRPDSIGKYASRGCVGMLQKDVEELYDLIPIRTKVTILGERPKIDFGATETTSETKHP